VDRSKWIPAQKADVADTVLPTPCYRHRATDTVLVTAMLEIHVEPNRQYSQPLTTTQNQRSLIATNRSKRGRTTSAMMVGRSSAGALTASPQSARPTIKPEQPAFDATVN
jgi:hypothetical protein